MKFQGKIMPFRLFTLKKHLFGTDNPLCKYRNPLKLLQNFAFSLKMDDVTLSWFGWETEIDGPEYFRHVFRHRHQILVLFRHYIDPLELVSNRITLDIGIPRFLNFSQPKQGKVTSPNSTKNLKFPTIL